MRPEQGSGLGTGDVTIYDDEPTCNSTKDEE